MSPPMSQPPFWQRHPILTGLAAGVAGSWIGHMLFGANNSLAADAESTESNAGSFFNFFLLLVIGLGAIYVFMRLRRSQNTAPAYSGFSSGSVNSTTMATTSLGGHGVISQPEPVTSISSGDTSIFTQILRDVQAAWSRQDLEMLKRLVTPEMLHYFSSTLAENASREVENHVEDLTVVSAQVQETWQEDQTDYATVLLRWAARDYDVALNKTRGEAGNIVAGDERTPTEISETWTFMRYRQGKWLLSAIQQVESPLAN
jgi:predicted lipid-binding transport protein (Tim44 family)